MKHLLAKKIIDNLNHASSVQTLIEDTVRSVSRQEKGKILLAIIAMDKNGNIGAARNVELTPHAYFSKGMKKPRVSFAPIVK
jgi:isoaspartyl peptidase/L-asparaginase-like protein (Ntn-hydrolase superfamily)